MSDRIQKALDGDLRREDLRAGERAELEGYEEAVDAALAGLRAESAPDLTRDVMRRVAALPRHGGASPWQRAVLGAKRGFAWLWSPRPVTLRPAWGLAAAAVAALLLVAPWNAGARPGAPGVDPRSPIGVDSEGAAVAAARVPDERIFVHFRLDAAQANRVQLAADFTGWQPTYTLAESAPGVWTVVVPVEPGVHQYAFVVDGERWVADPLAPRVDDGFGGTNSRLDVVRPEARSAL